MRDKQTCIDIIGMERCTGCFGCQTACAQGAIHLILDAEGFYKPRVDHAICTHCGVCQQQCPVLAYDTGHLPTGNCHEPKTFAAWSLDESVRLASTSGGLFSELARPVIADSGVVAGCAWGAEWTPEHILASTWPEVGKMRGSKYVPSKVGDLYVRIVKFLRENTGPVMFVGTPCQVAAMALALRGERRDRVLLVDLICDGVPSLRVFHTYLNTLFPGGQVASYMFREKSFGWEESSVRAESFQGHCHHVRCWLDPFVAGSQAHRLYNLAACHACVFARLPRPGDITLGDFWGCPEKWKDRRGVSAVLANTAAGVTALEALMRAGQIALEPVELDTIAKGNPRLLDGYYSMPENRRAFLDGVIAGVSFDNLWDMYGPHSVPRWRAWWSRFQGSDAKTEFLVDFVQRLFQRITKHKV